MPLPPPTDRPSTARDPDYRNNAILVAAAQLDNVQQALSELFDATLKMLRKGRIVVLWSDDAFDVPGVIEALRTWPRSLTDGFRLTVSPRHIVALGQPNVRGNPFDGPARRAARGFAERKGTEGQGTTVAIIDTGIIEHPWLDGAYVALPGDFEREIVVPDESKEADERVLEEQAGHGLFLAGLVLEQAPGATVKVLRTAKSDGTSDIDDVAEAIVRAAALGVDVVNLSLGCFTRAGLPPWTLLDALERVPRTTAVVAAAGNSTAEPPASFWPAALRGVTAVGALGEETDNGWELAKFTNRGSWVDVYVPATNVLSTYLERDGYVLAPDGNGGRDASWESYGGWARWSGTSMAAAIWSGAVARGAAEWGVSAMAAERRILDLPSTVDFVRELKLVPEHRDELDTRVTRRALDVVPTRPRPATDE
jgi:subtilisin family serine protease